MYKFWLLNREISGRVSISVKDRLLTGNWTKRLQATPTERQPAWKTAWLLNQIATQQGKGDLNCQRTIHIIQCSTHNHVTESQYPQCACFGYWEPISTVRMLWILRANIHSAHALGATHAEYAVHVKYCKHARIQQDILSLTSAISLRLTPLMICMSLVQLLNLTIQVKPSNY